MIKELGQEYELQASRISDSVSTSAIDAVIDESEKPPLIESIGVGGTQSLAVLISSMGNGQISVEQASILLRVVFGMDEESANQIARTSKQNVSEEVPQTESELADENKPTQGMISEAIKGLEWRRKFKRGGTSIGVARARDISNGKNLSDDTVKRMHSFFSRHEVDKQGKGFTPDEDGFPSNGRIAWALWGGDAGQTWAAKKIAQMNRA